MTSLDFCRTRSPTADGSGFWPPSATSPVRMPGARRRYLAAGLRVVRELDVIIARRGRPEPRVRQRTRADRNDRAALNLGEADQVMAGLTHFSGALHVFRSKRTQYAAFCIQSSKRDNCVSVASPSRTNDSSRAAPTRQDLTCIYIEERAGLVARCPIGCSTKVTVLEWRLDQPGPALVGSRNSPLF